VRGVAAQQATETNDSVVFFAFGKGAGRRGNFKSARHADNFDFLLLGATLHQPVEGRLQQSIGNKSVESDTTIAKRLPAVFSFPSIALIRFLLCDFNRSILLEPRRPDVLIWAGEQRSPGLAELRSAGQVGHLPLRVLHSLFGFGFAGSA
jgi:hypothetical protein